VRYAAKTDSRRAATGLGMRHSRKTCFGRHDTYDHAGIRLHHQACSAFSLVTVVLSTAVAGRAGSLAPLAIGNDVDLQHPHGRGPHGRLPSTGAGARHDGSRPAIQRCLVVLTAPIVAPSSRPPDTRPLPARPRGDGSRRGAGQPRRPPNEYRSKPLLQGQGKSRRLWLGNTVGAPQGRSGAKSVRQVGLAKTSLRPRVAWASRSCSVRRNRSKDAADACGRGATGPAPGTWTVDAAPTLAVVNAHGIPSQKISERQIRSRIFYRPRESFTMKRCRIPKGGAAESRQAIPQRRARGMLAPGPAWMCWASRALS